MKEENEENGEEMYLIWYEEDKSYALLPDEYGGETIGKLTISSEASDFITALNLLTGITDADCRELTDPIDEIITKCVKLVLEKQHQPVL